MLEDTIVNNIDDYVGYVYKVTEISSGRIYYGIKQFFKKIRRKPLKGKKRTRIAFKESDWRSYKTSSPYLIESITANPANYKCEIIRLCKSITEMKAYEAYYQLNEYISGNWDNTINEVINLRLRIRKSNEPQ